MVREEYVKKLVIKTKKKIDKCIKRNKLDDALSMISICANILYQTNIYYSDNDLERYIRVISEKLKLNEYENEDGYDNNDFLLFYDGFGLNDRGLVQIYLKALCKIKRVIYVTYEERKDLIPDVHKILDEYKCERRYLNRRKKTYQDIINQLNYIIMEFKPAKFFFFSKHLPVSIIAKLIGVNDKRLWRFIKHYVNYFEYRLTNAILEGINSIIQNIKRRARCFRNNEYFTTMIYLNCSNLDIDAVIANA